jgi:hypothetical protein
LGFGNQVRDTTHAAYLSNLARQSHHRRSIAPPPAEEERAQEKQHDFLCDFLHFPFLPSLRSWNVATNDVCSDREE